MQYLENRRTALADRLFLWYRHHHRKLPWRGTRDPYKIWISEIMLQQTTVPVVIPYYSTWLKLFPDIQSLSQSPLQKVLKAWQGLGYYQRAKNLHNAARIIVEKFGGQIPKDYEELKKLPGFGPYTTAAVLSLAFDKLYPVIDANVRRVLMRTFAKRGSASPKLDTSLRSLLAPHLPSKKMGEFNQAMMELGALVCRPKNPLCLICPLTSLCRAYQEGIQEIIPKPKKRSYRKIEAVVGIIKKEDKYLIQKRPPSGLFADLWEFPGGKRNPGESLEEALRRELKEELGVVVNSMKLLTQVKHAYTQYQVVLSAYSCKLEEALLCPKHLFRWVALSGFKHYPFPSGSAKIIKFLQEK